MKFGYLALFIAPWLTYLSPWRLRKQAGDNPQGDPSILYWRH